MPSVDVAVVGAGLSGLACALRLAKGGAKVTLLEARRRVGGRVCTDTVNGFLLDRGFQVLLTAYPEARAVLDYEQLQLCYFRPGAVVRTGGAFHTLADPLREPGEAVRSALTPIGSLRDKLRLARMRIRVGRGSAENLLSKAPLTSLAYLTQCGFSDDMLQQFWCPFLSGIFLENRLATTSLKLEFVFRMFSEGYAAIPRKGMGAIPEQLALRLPEGSIRLSTPVSELNGTTLTTSSGEQVRADYVVLAVERPEAVRLARGVEPTRACSTVCLYFDAPERPLEGAWLVLNGERAGYVNNLCVLSEVCPDYGPTGRFLVSATIVGSPEDDDASLELSVREQLTVWFGPVVQAWRHLRTYRIPYALPMQGPNDIDPLKPAPNLSDRVLVCGDYTHLASTHGALVSGRRAAEAILTSERT